MDLIQNRAADPETSEMKIYQSTQPFLTSYASLISRLSQAGSEQGYYHAQSMNINPDSHAACFPSTELQSFKSLNLSFIDSPSVAPMTHSLGYIDNSLCPHEDGTDISIPMAIEKSRGNKLPKRDDMVYTRIFPKEVKTEFLHVGDGEYSKMHNKTYTAICSQEGSSLEKNQKSQISSNHLDYLLEKDLQSAWTKPVPGKTYASSSSTSLKQDMDILCNASSASLAKQISTSIPTKVKIPRYSKSTFICILYIIAVCNFDHGGIPPSLDAIARHFSLSFKQQSLLGSLVYLGLIIGVFISGILSQMIEAKYLLLGSLITLKLAMLMLVFANDIKILFFSRLVSGVSQAIPSVLIPVWVDKFAPESSKVRWMSYVHLSTILGTSLGYITAGYFSSSRNVVMITMPTMKNMTSWQHTFSTEVWLLVPVIFLLILRNTSSLNVITQPLTSKPQPGNSKASLEEITTMTSPIPRAESTMQELIQIFSHGEYIAITLGLSNLFFVVTGVQFWILRYLTEGLHFDKLKVIKLSVFCFVTSPTLGVYLGGVIIDMCGSHTTFVKFQIRIITILAAVASILSIIAAFTTSFSIFAGIIWLSLLVGSAVVPIAMIISISFIPPHLKSLSSATSQFFYNLLGWFSAPLLTGITMDLIAARGYDSPLPLIWGFRLLLISSTIGFLCFAMLNFYTNGKEFFQKFEHEIL